MTTITQPSTINVTNPQGSAITQVYVLTNADGSLYPLTGVPVEYVVRLDAVDTSVTPLLKLTTSSSAAGVVSVNTSTSTVTVTVNPAATLAFAPGLYAHALWTNPTLTTALVWVRGQFITQGVAQP